jgi:hypothetical protein
MAQVPAAVASTATASIGAQVGSFVVNLGANYLLGRLAAQDGPRLGNLSAAGGEYGVAMPKLFGEKVRCTGIFIAQADIKETRHTVEDYSEIVGALTGAVQGFMVGGPVGAVVGAVIGGLLGAATPNQHYYTYSDTFALLLADRFGDDPIEGINKMWAAGKVIFAGTEPVVAQTFDGAGRLVMKKWGKNKFFKSLTLHTGADVQALDPVLGSVLGETSGYPFTAYVTFEDLQLMAWGNSVPAVDVLTSVATGQTVAGTVERIAGAAGIDTKRDISTRRSSTGSTAVTRSPARRAAGTRSSRCCRRSESTRPRCRDRSASSSATRLCARRSRPRTWARTPSAMSRPSASPSPARRTSICRRRPASPSSTRRAITRRTPRARRGPRAAPSRTSA